MNITKGVLGKDIHELQYNDVVEYFKTPKTESNVCEYKSCPNGKANNENYKGILKAICALLNSEGGVIIWGAPKGKKVNRKDGKTEKVFTGELTPISDTIEHDTIVNKIVDSVIPIPNNIRINPLENDGRFIVVFEVEKSAYAPHQTSDIYYMRLDGQSRPAPHHYIEALFKQIKYPNLGGYIKFCKTRLSLNNVILSLQVYIVNHSPVVNEESVSFQLASNIGTIPMSPDYTHKYGKGENQIQKNNITDILHYGSIPFSNIDVFYSSENLTRYGYKDTIEIIFGGKKSPLKQSSYEINLNPIIPENINDIEISRRENILMSDLDVLKVSEEEKVNIILGRK